MTLVCLLGITASAYAATYKGDLTFSHGNKNSQYVGGSISSTKNKGMYRIHIFATRSTGETVEKNNSVITLRKFYELWKNESGYKGISICKYYVGTSVSSSGWVHTSTAPYKYDFR